MRKSRRLLGVLVGFAAASLMLAQIAPAADQPSGLALGPADAGRTVTLAVGETLTVGLPSQPGTGYSWQAAENSTPVLTLSGTRQRGANMPGAVETQRLTFVARAPGAGRLRLVYRRPWEKGGVPTKSFTVMVKIVAQ